MLIVPEILLLAVNVTQEIEQRVLSFISQGDINCESV
jgi:hypothetical protein